MSKAPIQENVSLQALNTFGIEAYAKYFAEIGSVAELTQLLTDASLKNIRKISLGEGSNVLLTQNLDALVIKNNIKSISVAHETDQHAWLRVGAGENWHQFVLHSIAQGYQGLENLSFIPGSAGAAPIQNIGAYGIELQHFFDSLESIRIADGTKHVFKYNDCQFDYRNSIFKHGLKDQFVITHITLKLNKTPVFNTQYPALQQELALNHKKNLSAKIISDTVIKIRQNKLPDPKKIGNAGSFFKNPVVSPDHFQQLKKHYPNIPSFSTNNNNIKIPAAWLIEQMGWKGKRFQSVGIHEQQPLVLVNYGNGNGSAIKSLAEDIQASVQKQFDIALVPEVNIW